MLHEQGYNYFDIPKLSYVEIKDLFKGVNMIADERARKMKMKNPRFK